MKAILALYKAQAREFLRDKSAVLFILTLPVVFGAFFGLIFSGGGDFTLQLGIANEGGPEAEALLAGLPMPAPPEGELVEGGDSGVLVRWGSREELLEALESGALHVVMVLPPETAGAVATGQTVEVAVYYDPSRTTSAGVGLGIVRRLLDEVNMAISGASRTLEMREETVQTKTIRPVDFYIPGMLGVALLWLGIFGVAQPVVAQRESHIMRRFSVTAINRYTMLIAEVSWRVSVGVLQAGVFLLVGYLAFGIGVERWLPFAAAVLMGILVFVCMGYVLAGVARTTESAMAISQLVNFPMMMLSGSMFDVEMLPDFFQPVVAFMPLTYLSDLLRQTMTGLTPVNPSGLDFAVLGGWLVALFVLAVWLWRWE